METLKERIDRGELKRIPSTDRRSRAVPCVCCGYPISDYIVSGKHFCGMCVHRATYGPQNSIDNSVILTEYQKVRFIKYLDKFGIEKYSVNPYKNRWQVHYSATPTQNMYISEWLKVYAPKK